MASRSLRLMAGMVALAVSGIACAAAQNTPEQGGTPAAAFMKAPFALPAALRGTLGDAQVQMNLRAKPDEDGVEGDYFFFGRSQKVLLAGEAEGNELALEESENGKDVSGQWYGTLKGDTLTGEWASADGSVTKPFRLVVLPAAQQRQQSAGAGASLPLREKR